MGTFYDKHLGLEQEVMKKVSNKRLPEELIANGTPEERIWAVGVLSNKVRLKDVPEYMEALFEASSEIRRQNNGKEDKIERYFKLGKEGRHLPIRVKEDKDIWMD